MGGNEAIWWKSSVRIVLGLMLVNPLLPNPSDVAKGVADAITFTFFGLDLNVVGYQGSVLPA